MSEERITELELQLVAANASIAKLTTTGLELTHDLADAEARNKKLKRTVRRNEHEFKDQLAIAQNRRG